MKFWILFSVLVISFAALSFSGEQTHSAALPSALDNYYPPKAQGPAFLFKMLELNGAFSGVAVNLFEEDFENAASNFATFQEKYAELSKLIPDWEHYFDLDAVTELGSAMKAGDQGRVMGAFGKVGGTCHSCHTANMPSVQFRYHWDDFSKIRSTDPVTNADVDFAQLMQQLAMSFDGIHVDLKEGQIDRAIKHGEDFAKRFSAMRETCGACHQTERKYFADDGVQAMVDQLSTALKAASPDPAAIGKLSQGIGMESCHKCHLVHIPAAAFHARSAASSKTAHE